MMMMSRGGESNGVAGCATARRVSSWCPRHLLACLLASATIASSFLVSPSSAAAFVETTPGTAARSASPGNDVRLSAASSCVDRRAGSIDRRWWGSSSGKTANPATATSLSFQRSSTVSRSTSFSPSTSSTTRTTWKSGAALEPFLASTVEAPTKERTDRKTGGGTGEDTLFGDDFGDGYDDDQYDDLEYLYDARESREMKDPFHILLLGSTFEKPKVTVPYVVGSLEYVLGMPKVEATELSKFARDEGMSCLGTWTREECLSLGRQLQVRDIVCRVVPYVEGGQRGWQAKDVGGSGSSNFNGNNKQRQN